MDTYQPIPRPTPTGGRKIIMDYLAEQYGTEPEYPWLQYPHSCTFKTPVSHKWYAAILDVNAHVLGLSADRVVDIVNLKIDPVQLPALIDGDHYFAGYHMNKRHWLTVILDESTDYNHIKRLLDASYRLVEPVQK